ncbi:fungal-specific transcription factor domain-containing protein [Nemania abortiva]|nr:fungal-specific transcription factor domain-containing protein [Nemania abortiva]
MRYYITVLALHLTVSEEFNSFLSAFLPMAMESVVLRDALFAFASGHLALADKSYQGTAITASSMAIRSLAAAVSTPSADICWHETTAAACLVLMTAEVGVGDCRSWYTHLKGAKDIISTAVSQANSQHVRGSEAFKYSSEGQWILRNFAYHDIIGSVTLRKRPLLDGCYLESISDAVDSYLGVGTRLLSYVSEITCLDDETTPRDHMGDSELQEMRTRFHNSTCSLENRLNNWKCPAGTPGGLAAVAYAYRCAALILLYRLLRDRLGTTVLYSNDAENSRDRLIQIMQTKIRKQVDLTLTHIAEIPVGIGPESTLLFPLFLAGGEASEPFHIEPIRQRLLTILEQRQFRNVSRALEILEDLWALRQQENGAGVDWSQILETCGREILLT